LFCWGQELGIHFLHFSLNPQWSLYSIWGQIEYSQMKLLISDYDKPIKEQKVLKEGSLP
jgi:hypothetical protein